ncbi:MAG: type II toxin-antitoxin system RelE/ParE family toxin [Winogradskyella sp.]
MEENFSFSEEVKHELHKISCYLEYLDKYEDFFKDFIRQLKLIKKMPFSFQVRYRDVRIISFDNFDYSIHYRIVHDEIFVVHILNQRQNF